MDEPEREYTPGRWIYDRFKETLPNIDLGGASYELTWKEGEKKDENPDS